MPLTAAEKTKRYRERRYAEIDQMPKIACACGCGTLIAPIGKQLKPAIYAHGHNPTEGGFKPGQPSPWKGKPNPRFAEMNKNRVRTPEEFAKRTATRRAKYGPSYGTARGYKQSEEAVAKNRERGKTLIGEKNPFYGKKHTPETRALHSERFSGANHPGWRGGAATMPYGPEFTRKFKHLIRQRDNYTCQRCGKTQEQEGRVLQVHHLDHNKENNDPTNVVASCGSCNVWASYHRDEPFRS
jgi:hypothetical protein